MVSQNLPEDEQSELLYTYDIVLMSVTIEGLNNKFLRWKEVFEIKGLNANLVKNQGNGQQWFHNDGLSKSKVDQCEVCSLREMPNSDLCVPCGKWIHGRCTRVKG